ncbi:hypothetical protein [Parvibaculum sp.]|uniref:hypothetical protein n=1 Tax=Parvibaculum sp. TaxID=2024848 RepID=UPI0034A088F6
MDGLAAVQKEWCRMNGNAFPRAKVKRSLAVLTALALFGTAAALPAMAEEETPPADAEIHYETSDPVDSPPVNFRSDYDAEYDTQDVHEAEMYAEEYERRQREEKIRKSDQLDRINDFTSGAITTDGVTP